MEKIKKHLAERLRTARKRAGLKQVEAARRTGIHNKTLSGYENGVSEPDACSLMKLAALYGVSMEWIVSREEQYIPDDEFSRFVRYMEKKYGVTLHNDPVLVNGLQLLVETVARSRAQERLAVQNGGQQNVQLQA